MQRLDYRSTQPESSLLERRLKKYLKANLFQTRSQAKTMSEATPATMMLSSSLPTLAERVEAKNGRETKMIIKPASIVIQTKTSIMVRPTITLID
ncbi:hypothetical protein KEJ39_01525 [Candidatus Bathyarchaeota archaeon]|nr:hypothetical protein [Candidatus Bathyarchaeota archaeon]